MYQLEICAYGAESVALAQQAGAQRVELCAGPAEGGLTPSYGEVATAMQVAQSIRVHAIVRPRGGDFLYNALERRAMIQDVEMMRQLGVHGIAVGALTREGDIDIALMQEIIEVAGKQMSITCHRAFDMCRNKSDALEQLIALGCHRVLTSGGAATALEGAEALGRLVRQADNRIIIMPGCGVKASNLATLVRLTGAQEYHLSGRIDRPSTMIYRHEGVSMGGTVVVDEYSQPITSRQLVSEAVAVLDQLSREV